MEDTSSERDAAGARAAGAHGRGESRTAEPRDGEIYERIYAAIVEQHLIQPGTKLPEDTLAEAFGVGRTRIRQVLMRLAHEGVVTLQRNRGATVAKPSVKEARDVFAVRRILEAATTRGIATAASPAAIETLRRFVTEERAAFERHDRRTAIKLSGEFHLRIAELFDNSTLTDLLRGLVSRTSLIIAVYRTHDNSGCQFADHDELVRLLAARRADAAVALMERHLHSIEAGLQLEPTNHRRVNLREIFSQMTVPRQGE